MARTFFAVGYYSTIHYSELEKNMKYIPFKKQIMYMRIIPDSDWLREVHFH